MGQCTCVCVDGVVISAYKGANRVDENEDCIVVLGESSHRAVMLRLLSVDEGNIVVARTASRTCDEITTS